MERFLSADRHRNPIVSNLVTLQTSMRKKYTNTYLLHNRQWLSEQGTVESIHNVQAPPNALSRLFFHFWHIPVITRLMQP
jgi:hypothetical protein